MTVNGANVLKGDQKASNGVIHVIDRWLYQLPNQNALQYLTSHQEFTKYVNLFFPVGLEDLLKGKVLNKTTIYTHDLCMNCTLTKTFCRNPRFPLVYCFIF